jgi:hypothetical protein
VQVAAAGMDSPPESRDDAETTPNDAFNAFKEDIRLIIDDYTNLEIIEELKIKGFHTSLTALKYQLQDWGFRRQSGTRGVRTGVSEALINAVNDLFHHTLLNDAQIAARLLE